VSEVLSVRGLTKRYPGFTLDSVSFDLRPGAITGFIGRNGAGKSTTFKCLLNLVHPDEGKISFFGRPFVGNELSAKGELGFVLGGVDYYPTKKLRTITAVTKRFYPNWDEDAYRRYLAEFGLDENKTPKQLSDGMKVKYSLALALSHRARLLILDEPTSGLDPVSRDELTDVFTGLCEREGVTIFFSTHITSDLEKCAHDIIYIKAGKLVGAGGVAEFFKEYGMEHLEDVMVFIERGKRPQ
jgi:ABC-2 type transport system ATP-binding protein